MNIEVLGNRRFQSKTEQVVKTITELILTGDLENNSILPPENEMCGRLGISRSIFREAMKILAAKGLVEIKQGFGTSVKAPDEDVPAEALSNFIQLNQIPLLQIMEVRGPIEIEIAKLAANRRKKKHLDEMERSLGEMVTNREDHDICVQADNDFHRALVSSTENPLFIIISRSIERFFRYLRKITIQFGVDKVVKEHRAIMEAIRDKDPAASALAMEKHMRATIEDLKRLYHENGKNLAEKIKKTLV